MNFSRPRVVHDVRAKGTPIPRRNLFLGTKIPSVRIRRSELATPRPQGGSEPIAPRIRPVAPCDRPHGRYTLNNNGVEHNIAANNVLFSTGFSSPPAWCTLHCNTFGVSFKFEIKQISITGRVLLRRSHARRVVTASVILSKYLFTGR